MWANASNFIGCKWKLAVLGAIGAIFTDCLANVRRKVENVVGKICGVSLPDMRLETTERGMLDQVQVIGLEGCNS